MWKKNEREGGACDFPPAAAVGLTAVQKVCKTREFPWKCWYGKRSERRWTKSGDRNSKKQLVVKLPTLADARDLVKINYLKIDWQSSSQQEGSADSRLSC